MRATQSRLIAVVVKQKGRNRTIHDRPCEADALQFAHPMHCIGIRCDLDCEVELSLRNVNIMHECTLVVLCRGRPSGRDPSTWAPLHKTQRLSRLTLESAHLTWAVPCRGRPRGRDLTTAMRCLRLRSGCTPRHDFGRHSRCHAVRTRIDRRATDIVGEVRRIGCYFALTMLMLPGWDRGTSVVCSL